MGTTSGHLNGHDPKVAVQPYQLAIRNSRTHFDRPKHLRCTLASNIIWLRSWLLMAFVLMLFLPPQLLAARSIALQWDACDPAPSSYPLYQREAGQNNDDPKWVNEDTETRCTLDYLEDSITDYFVARAMTVENQSSNVLVDGVSKGAVASYTFPSAMKNHPIEAQFTTLPVDTPPLADAGPGQKVTSLSSVTLNGSGSSDPDGGALTYRWHVKNNTTVRLSNPNSVNPSFTAPEVSEGNIYLQFELSVTNTNNDSSSDTCFVQVNASNDSPIDADGDGISDIEYLDDDDGITNLEAYQKGTNPLSADENLPPHQAAMIYPENGDTDVALSFKLKATAFDDPNQKDRHAKSQWRIQTTPDQETVFDIITTSGRSTEIKLPPHILNPNTRYMAQVRYFDKQHLPSEWSLPATFTTTADSKDRNKNRIPDDQEVSESTDLNRDDILDSDQVDEIRRFRNYNHKCIIGVSIESSDNVTAIEAVANIDPADLDDAPPSEDEMPYGVMSYKIHVAEPGQTARVKIFLSEPIDAETTWVRYDHSKGWQNCTDHVQMLDEQGFSAERDLIDGGDSDLDGTANGVIVDMVAPQSEDGSSLSLGDGPASDGGSSRNCFIQSLF